MSNLSQLESHYEELIYQLLPQLYRSRDSQGELKKFVEMFGHELARLRANIDQLQQDFFIDSCQEWVIPYIGDLVGTTVLFNEGARNRADVKNTIRWRREKGTLAGLEDIAAQIGDWGALAAEMFQELIWSQNLNHLRPRAHWTVNLSDASSVAKIGTPMDQSCRVVDIRPIDGVMGAYQISNVGFWLWMMASQPVAGIDPSQEDARRYYFSPLKRDQILYAGGDKPASCAAETDPSNPADICLPHANDLPIRGRDFHDHPDPYWGTDAGFGIYEDGILLCEPAPDVINASVEPSIDFAQLAQVRGMVVTDPGLFAAKPFRINAIRLRQMSVDRIDADGHHFQDPIPIVPAGPFVNNYVQPPTPGAFPVNASIDTSGMVFAKGFSFDPTVPELDQSTMLLRIERTGADPNFPECEVILRNSTGEALLVFLPAVAGIGVGQSMHLYVANDGSTYFARNTHDPGDIDLNPNSAFFGAYLPRHLARKALAQVRPRAGVRPVTHRKIVERQLCCWDHTLQKPLAPGEVAVDPERGRFVFPAGEEPTGRVTVNYRYALTGQVGAGPYFRDPLLAPTLQVSQTNDAPFRTIQAALNAAPGNSPSPVVIEIQDSHTYNEALVVKNNFPGGLVIQARALETPVVISPGADVLQIGNAISGASFILDGLTLSNGKVTVRGDVPKVKLRFCSLDPASPSIDCQPKNPGGTLELDQVITGSLKTSANVASAALTDTAVQNTTGATALDMATTALSLEHVTVVGDTLAQTLMASNAILFGQVTLGDAANSCFRYTRYPREVTGVRLFHCTTLLPIFSSFQFGHPAYLGLSVNTPAALRRGGEEGGEMGVWYAAGIPWREQNVMLKLREYLPAGLKPVPMRAMPRTRFVGVKGI
jgi:hypothetical protein